MKKGTVATALVAVLVIGLAAAAGAAITPDQLAKRSIEARAWAAEHPASCALLDNPDAVGMMDGLLLKLAVLCERPDLLGAVLAEEGDLPGESRDTLGVDVLVNNPGTDSGSSRTQSETSVARDETTGVLCSGYNDSFHGVTQSLGYTGFSSSTDGGATWTDHGALGSRSFGDPGLVWRKSDGNFYFVALDSSGLGIWRSTDGCQTFTFLSNPHVSGSDDKELMAVDNNPANPHYGRLYVAWTDFTDGRIKVVTSDNGTTWSSPVALSASGVSVQGAWPAVAPNGDVWVDWVRFNPWPAGPIDVEVARSTSGGASFSPVANPLTGGASPQAAGPTSSCGRPALNGNIRYLPSPQIAVGPDGAVHVVYSYDPDGMGTGDVINVYYRRSTDNGATWGPEVQLNDDGTTRDQFFPTLSVGATNVVSAAWYDRRNDPSNLNFQYYQRMSFDGGVTWGASTLLSDASSGVVLDPNLATCYHGDYDTQIQSPSAAIVIWADDRPLAQTDPNVWNDTVAISSDFLVLATPASQTICAGADATIDISVPSFNGFTNPVTLSVAGNPGGTTTGFSVNPVTPPGSSVLTIGNTGGVGSGSYPMTITGTSGAATHDGSSTLVVQAGSPAAPTLVSPADGATAVSTHPTLVWNAAAGADDYYVEVDDNADFSSPAFTATVAGTTVQVNPGIAIDTQFYWRVTAQNSCGGSTSTVFTFRTGVVYCATPNLLIPDNNPTGVTNDIVVPDGGTLQDVDVSLAATHTWVGDLIFNLTHVDTGTSVSFFNRPGYTGSGFGCGGDNVNVIANDTGPDTPIENQCGNLPAISGNAEGGDPPSSSLFAAFAGEDLAGTWRITASDNAGGDSGTLNAWCLMPSRIGPQITLAKTVGTDPGVCAATDSITVTSGTTVYYCYHVVNTGSEALFYHTLVDDDLGELLHNEPLALYPNDSTDYIVPHTVNATVTNTATWTAVNSLGGYNADDTIGYNFEDISGTGTDIPLGDDQVSGPIPIGFSFDFFGTPYTDVYVSSNGFLTVLPGQSNGCCTGQPIPTAGSPDGIISPWWEDLFPPGGGSIKYQLLGSAPNRYMIVQYTNIQHYPSGNPVTMQVKLFEGTNVIEVHYQSAPSDGGTHSAGVENEDGTVGLQYFLGTTSLSTPLAVRYTPVTDILEASATDSATVTVADPDIAVSPSSMTSTLPPGQTDTQVLTIQNNGVADLDWMIEEAAPLAAPLASPQDVGTKAHARPAATGHANSIRGALGKVVVETPIPGVLPAPARSKPAPLAREPRATGTYLNQLPNAVNGLFADFACSLCPSGQQSIAENFVLAAPALIGQITFWGGYFSTDTPLTTDVIRVLVHSDSGGVPGAVVYDESNVASTRVQTGVVLFGVHEWEFTLTLAAPVNLSAGTYWIELFNDTTGNPDDFFWETGNLDGTHGSAGSGWATATPAVSWNFDGATDMAIQLDGPASPCYTPSDLTWVSEDVTSGTTTAGNSSTVNVTFDSTGLAQGTYDGIICVESNDPDTPLVEVPVSLTVTGDMPFIDGFETGDTSRWSLTVP